VLRHELEPHGLEIVTVALDSRGAGAARPWIEAAGATHPSLIDEAHVLDDLLGVVNVPSGTWIDEGGTIVRPPEPAFPTRLVADSIASATLPEDAPPRRRQSLAEARKIRFEPEAYVEGLRDWVTLGARSRLALAPDEVIARSPARSPEVARAAACFELGQHVARRGDRAGAVPHFREALRLQPDNWTHRREAYALLDAGQDPLHVYGSDWLSEVMRMGAENYYPPLDM